MIDAYDVSMTDTVSLFRAFIRVVEAGSFTRVAQEQNRHQALVDAVAANRHSLEMAESLFVKGRVNFLDVLDTRRTLYQADDLLAVSDQAVAIDLIALYKALGGGWETLAPQATNSLSTAPSP